MIYLDHAATTPVVEEVLEKMWPFFNVHYANPASQIYPEGRLAKRALDRSMQMIAGILKVEVTELYLTSGATQSCNWALRGLWEHYGAQRKKIMISQIEHSAVIATAQYLEKKYGAEVVWIPTLKNGLVDLEFVQEHLNDEYLMLGVMAVNNITGVIQPIKELGQLAQKYDVYYFCDATQGMASIDLQPEEYFIDLMAFSAHKFYGPKGVGMLYAKRRNPRVNLPIWEYGGGMELWKKGGTINLPSLVGMAEALNWSRKQDWSKVSALRSELETYLQSLGGQVIGREVERVVSHSNMWFEDISGHQWLNRLQESISFSLSSACSSNETGPSHVLKVMDLEQSALKGAFRLSWGVGNTFEEMNQVKESFLKILKEIKS